jgi:hypothetical protein
VKVPFARAAGSEREEHVRRAFLLAALACLLALKLIAVDTGDLTELLLYVSFDSLVLIWLWLLSELVASVGRPWLASAFYFPALYSAVGLVFAHASFYPSAVERRLTLLDVTVPGIVEYFSAALSFPWLCAFFGLYVGLHVLGYLIYRFLPRPSTLSLALATLPLLLTNSLGLLYAPRTPSVMFDTAADLYGVASLPRLHARASPRARKWIAHLHNGGVKQARVSTPFKKVIVLVLETMTQRALNVESEPLSPETFLRSAAAHTHRYTRYFPNNQDSRTGMLDMLMSRLIPHEAYLKSAVAVYGPLQHELGLVEQMKTLGFQTAFAVSQTELELVVGDLAWNDKLHLSLPEIADAKKQGLLCIQPDDWENGCEDLALLPKIMSFVERHERAFVYQELIWGHDILYNDRSGRSNASYYSSYIDQLLKELQARNLQDETLLVVTSDHGFRDQGLQDELWVYQIPLWFYAPRFQERTHDELLSHLDFRDLLVAELDPNTVVQPAYHPLVMIVGPTRSNMIAAIGQQGSFLLFKERFGRELLLAQHGPGELSGDELVYAFHSYRSLFPEQLRKGKE